MTALNRRALFGAGIAIAAMPLMVAASPVSGIEREIEIMLAEMGAMNAAPELPEATWDEYFAREKALLSRVMALKGDSEAVQRVRMKALMLCHSNDLTELWDGAFGECTNQQIGLKIVRSMMINAGIA